MNARPRTRKTKNLPVNLYLANGGKSYRYKHPITGKQFGMGSNKAEAIRAAKQLNSILVPETDLIREVLGKVTVSSHIQWMREHSIPDRDYSRATLELTEVRFRNLISEFGNKSIDEVTVKDVATLCESKTPRVSNQIRQAAMDLFKTAMARGVCNDNPAEVTIKRQQKKTRQRLSLQQFYAIKEAAPFWLQQAMSIALLTLQRRQDITLLKFCDVRDDFLYVIQHKTQKHDAGYLKIALSNQLLQIIENCNDKVPSPFIIHRNPSRKLKRPGMDHWTQIKPEMISRQFKKITDSLDIFADQAEEVRPTFHEIRALGIKLYNDAGTDPQSLAGHSDEKMTKNYDSGHEDIRWVEVTASLDIRII